MTNEQLMSKLKGYPPDAKVRVRWEDFAISDIDDICWNGETIYITHDCVLD